MARPSAVATGIDSFTLGLGFTLSSLAGVTAMAFGGMIGRRFSNRSVILGVLPLLALNLVLLLVATSFWLFFASLIAIGLCAVLMVVAFGLIISLPSISHRTSAGTAH